MGVNARGLVSDVVRALVWALALWGLLAEPSAAAVRRCHGMISSRIAHAATEVDARKAAMAEWLAKAAALGPGFDRWQLAADRALQCYPAKAGGGFDCIAIGAPCVIQQNPKQQPAGEDRKGQPL